METATKQPTMAEETGKRGRGRPSSRQTAINKCEIVKMANADALATHQEIADKVGVCRQTVSQTLAKYGISKQDLEDYRDNQADILLGLQGNIVRNITSEKLEKTSAKDLAICLGITVEKHRLITGQSTVNLASIVSIATKAEAAQNDACIDGKE